MTKIATQWIATAVLGFSVSLSALRQAPAPAPAAAVAQPPPNGRTYVGSQACAGCHRTTYERWSKTRMANVVTDPKVHPEVVLGNFAAKDPALTFTLAQVAFAYGTKWKQRYFTKVGDDYFPLGAQWDVAHKQRCTRTMPLLIATGRGCRLTFWYTNGILQACHLSPRAKSPLPIPAAGCMKS